MPTYSLLVQSTVISMDAYKQHRSLRVQKLQRCQLNFAQPAERKHVLCKGLMLSAVKMGYNSAKQLDCHQPLLFPTCRKRKKLFLPKPKCVTISKSWRNLQPFWSSISTVLLVWLQIAGNPGGASRGEECNPREF